MTGKAFINIVSRVIWLISIVTVGESNMFIVLVITVFATFVEAGYHVNVPSTPLELPGKQLLQQINNVGGHVPPDVTFTTIHTPEPSVSYAISHTDYEYLKQQKSTQIPYIYQGPQPHSNQLNDINANNHVNTINDALIADSGHNVNSGYPAQQANVATQFGNIGKYQVNVPTVNTLIKKHVYFHVPPPEFEEPQPVVRAPPPQKVYKIIFIKVPSQETSINVARLQQALQSQQTPLQDKTLIYVLSKKEEPQQQVVVPKPTTFDHEVFFVKYNGNANNVAAQINDELNLVDAQSGSRLLQPGLPNGLS